MSEIKGVGGHYDKVDFTKGPAIYSNERLYDTMYLFGEFAPREQPFVVMDAMSGKGLVGKEMSKRLKRDGIPHELHFLDVAEKSLQALASEGYVTCFANVTEGIPYNDGALDRMYCRFGIKNYPRDLQMKIIQEFLRLLKKGDIFVLTDMIAPEGAYKFMQEERRMKHNLGDIRGDAPHIPTKEMWYQMLRDCGFQPKKESDWMSYVTTNEWVASNQISEDALRIMNGWLLNAPEAAKRAMNIREEDGKVRIDYPVIVISAEAV
jgi:ubiquinone/menaquinone biosynthesis C-methylase UbiE